MTDTGEGLYADVLRREHAAVRASIRSIEVALDGSGTDLDAASGEQLLLGLLQLRDHLERHFAYEEQGVYPALEGRGATVETAARGLLAEHPQLLAGLQHLIERFHDEPATPGLASTFGSDVRGFLAALALHEEAENELVGAVPSRA